MAPPLFEKDMMAVLSVWNAIQHSSQYSGRGASFLKQATGQELSRVGKPIIVASRYKKKNEASLCEKDGS